MRILLCGSSFRPPPPFSLRETGSFRGWTITDFSLLFVEILPPSSDASSLRFLPFFVPELSSAFLGCLKDVCGFLYFHPSPLASFFTVHPPGRPRCFHAMRFSLCSPSFNAYIAFSSWILPSAALSLFLSCVGELLRVVKCTP